MTRFELISGIADAIQEQEGFNVTEAQAKARGIAWPTLAQVNANPGNLRSWPGFPVVRGYAQFPGPETPTGFTIALAWREDFAGSQAKCITGRLKLIKQVENNVFGLGPKDSFPLRNHGMNLMEFFGGQRNADGTVKPGGYPGYAPGADRNDPGGYARFVAKRIGVAVDKRLRDCIDDV